MFPGKMGEKTRSEYDIFDFVASLPTSRIKQDPDLLPEVLPHLPKPLYWAWTSDLLYLLVRPTDRVVSDLVMHL